MLGFVVAFRPKSKSKNWDEDCLLLQNTLKSVCNQADQNFRVFLVYTDLPAITPDAKITLVKFPYNFVEKQELFEAALLNDPLYDVEKNNRVEFDYDKSKRILFGCAAAREAKCDFIMSVDADDLISSRIAGFVNGNLSEKFGWYVDKGYIRTGNSRVLIKMKHGLSDINGSSNIVRMNLVPVPDFNSRLVPDFAFFHWHSWLKYRLREQFNDSLKPLPFYGTIYVLHNSSLSGYNRLLKKEFLKTTLKYLVNGRWLSRGIRKEFGI
jgi:hypothetical protein